MKAKNFATALCCAIALALPFVVPTIDRVATWKIVLGVAGLILFISAGMSKT